MTIKDIDINTLLPITIDDVTINTDLILQLKNNIIGESIMHWKKQRGGVFLKDLKKLRKGETVNYIKVEDKDESYIAKIINEEDIELYNHCSITKLNDIKIIKIINLVEQLNPNSKLLDVDINIDDENTISTETYSIPLEDEEIEKFNNLTLFE